MEAKILFDTSYLLPYISIPIDIGIPIEKFKDQLKLINKKLKNEIVITTTSLMEMQWKAIRIYRNSQNEEILNRANISIPLLFREYQIIEPFKDERILTYANDLLVAGHRDFMDSLIFSTAKRYNLLLITEEIELLNLIKGLTGWSDLKSTNWTSFVNDRVNYGIHH